MATPKCIAFLMELRQLKKWNAYPLAMTNIAMVKSWSIEIDGLPFLNMVIFHGELLNNQKVSKKMCIVYPRSILES